MSQIYKCDFCGTITDDIAGRVIIQMRNELAEAIYDREGIDPKERTRISMQHDGIVKDGCTDCLSKFITKPVKIKVLEHQANGDL